uniref:PDZ domain-containing protein n=1 Tax=Micrurus corallinus TaxID=54390 RepID=A0A2D4H4G8_MICCO
MVNEGLISLGSVKCYYVSQFFSKLFSGFAGGTFSPFHSGDISIKGYLAKTLNVILRYFLSSTGIYVQEMADTSTAKLYAGLLEVGDEILEVNGAKVAGLGLVQNSELLLWAETLSLRVLKQRPVRQ